MKTAKYEQILERKKVMPTAMRILTLEFLMTQANAVSLAEIEAQFYSADRITLYRTLKTFEKKGIIHSIQENNVTKYSLCQDNCTEDSHQDLHLHFYCKKCKNTMCLDEVDLSVVKMPQDYLIQELRFFGKGICKDCQFQTMQ